jgi:hypothetical protein
MPFTKFAYMDADVLEIKGTAVRQVTASLDTVGDYDNYRTKDGFMYVRIRAISSRVNKNHDGWPSTELAGSKDILHRHQSATGFTVEAKEGDKEKGFATFVGKPIFVDHNNSNPRRGRGVIVDSKFRVLDLKTAASDDYWKSSEVDPEHLPASEVELLLEVDAKQYPKFAKSIKNGDLDGFSMGANVEYTKCSHCGNIAHDPAEFCSHVMMKGAHHDIKTADGKRISKKSYENCYGCGFFEISGVFDPADETALTREVRASVAKEGIAIDPSSQDDALMNVPDPARPNDEAKLTDLAMQYHMQGVDWDDSIGMARNNLMRGPQETPAGHGEGEVYAPKQKDYTRNTPEGPQFDRQGMPGPGGLEGFPPPDRRELLEQRGIRPEPEMAGFRDDAQNAIDEQWPHRPVMNDPRSSTTKQAENPLPQDLMTKAPDEVDTLRQDQTCPICGNPMDSETCDVCGYVQPPKEFDNPDLQEAEKVRDEMKQQDESAATPQQASPDPGADPSQPSAAPGPGSNGPLTSKSPVAASVTNEMRWTPKVNAKTAARINQIEKPVRPSGGVTSNEPKDEIVKSDQTQPVTSAMRTARQLIAAAQHNNNGETMSTRTADGTSSDTPVDKGHHPLDDARNPERVVDVMGVGGVLTPSNEEASKADAQVDLLGVGGTGVSDVSAESTESLPTAAESSDDSGFNTDKTTEDSGPTKTYDDKDGQHSGVGEPVTSEKPYWIDESKWSHVRLHSDDDDKTLEQQPQQGDPAAQGGSAVKGVQPIAEQFGERVNLLEHKTSPANNSGPTDTWSGTDGNGVIKQQDPVTKEDQEWGGVKVPDVTLHTTAKARYINASRLLSVEQELGLTTEPDKWVRLAHLLDADPREIATRLATLDQVKVTGHRMAAQQKLATRVPRAFGNQTAANHDFQRIASDESEKEAVVDSDLDSALFTR